MNPRREQFGMSRFYPGPERVVKCPPFRVTILLWSFVSAMIVLAGAHWPLARMGQIRYRRRIVKDWKAIARARGLEISAEELDRIVGPLDALEESFRPLVQDLTVDVEPATGACGEEGEE